MPQVVVIGAGGGIGRAVVRREAAAGARLSLVDVSPSALREAETEARDRGATAVRALTADPATPAGAGRLAQWLAEDGRPVDGLVLAAGVTGPVSPIGDYAWPDFEEVVRINLHGPFLVLSHLLPLLTRAASASVVMLGSTSSIRGRANLSGYVAAKHGLVGLVRAAAMDLAGGAVRVNAVLPGPVDTPMLTALESRARATGRSFQRSGTGGVATPEDVAATIGFLLSPQAQHVRGAAWVVDGGVSIG